MRQKKPKIKQIKPKKNVVVKIPKGIETVTGPGKKKIKMPKTIGE